VAGGRIGAVKLVALALLVGAGGLLAEEPAGVAIPSGERSEPLFRIRVEPKVNSKRLTFDKKGVAFLAYKGEVLQPNYSLPEGWSYADGKITKPFSGIAFTEGDNWRAEVTYKDGILDGEVVVVANNKLLYRFRYEKGVKVVEK